MPGAKGATAMWLSAPGRAGREAPAARASDGASYKRACAPLGRGGRQGACSPGNMLHTSHTALDTPGAPQRLRASATGPPGHLRPACRKRECPRRRAAARALGCTAVASAMRHKSSFPFLHTCAELCVGAASAMLRTALRGGRQHVARVSPVCVWRPLRVAACSPVRATPRAPRAPMWIPQARAQVLQPLEHEL